MEKIILSAALISMMMACQNKVESQTNSQTKNENVMETNEKKAIENALKIYFKALNESNVSNAVAQYTDDGVFMPKEAPTASGKEQLKGAYEHVFSKLAFANMSFVLDEVVVEGNLAIVRTSSLGDLKILENGAAIKGATHRELFVMKKINSEWKIASYMFNTTAPAAAH